MENPALIRKKRAYEIFESRCVKMRDSKFLLAQPCVASVLKCIVNSPDLYQFLKDIISNIDCESELYKATIAHGRREFLLPESRRVMIALVTYILNQFDNDGIDMMEFIAYYYDPDTNIGYQVFCNEVLMPYCKAVKDAFLGEAAEEPEEAEEPERVNAALFEQADIIIKDIITCLRAENSLSENERTELIKLTEGMMIALSNMESRLIISVWIGMKYALSRIRGLSKPLKELERLLSGYLII